MSNFTYAEDAFIDLYVKVKMLSIHVDYLDAKPFENFYNLCTNNLSFTEKQGRFLKKLIGKYSNSVYGNNFLGTDHLVFKNSFRDIDKTKKISVVPGEDNAVYISFKFPYSFKEIFEAEFEKNATWRHKSFWDPETYSRKILLSNINLIYVYEFVKKHNFEIEESFLEAVSALETAWNDQDKLIPYSYIVNGQIILNSAPEAVNEYFVNACSKDLYKDMLLAKLMGYPVKFDKKPENAFEKLVSSKDNKFWIKDNNTFLSIYKKTEFKTCLIIDRTEEKNRWIEKFVNDAEDFGILRSKIKVCFREKNEHDSGFNSWIKENNLGGKVDDGDIFLFEHKPPKWIFKDKDFIKISATTMINLSTNPITKDFLETQPCVIYLTKYKPTTKEHRKIVEL